MSGAATFLRKAPKNPLDCFIYFNRPFENFISTSFF